MNGADDAGKGGADHAGKGGADENAHKAARRLPADFGRAVALALGVAATAMALRYLAIEPQAIGIACANPPAPWWCVPRGVLVLGFRHDALGIAAIVLAVAAWLFSPRALAVAALAVGAAGLVLYNAGAASVAAVLAILRLLRR